VLDGTTNETDCFGTFDEAIAYSTNGAITDATNPDVLAERLDSLPRDKAATIHEVGAGDLIAVFYEHWQYEGASLTVRGKDCYANVSQLTRHNWNDVITSFRVYNGCSLTLYEHEFFKGREGYYYENILELGPLNDKTSSLRSNLVLQNAQP
jgi:hypothetical protein